MERRSIEKMLDVDAAIELRRAAVSELTVNYKNK
jgi:hypothetical protein